MEAYPEIDADGQCSLKGVYIVGDLTGVPLLKMASESGARVVSALLADKDFASRRRRLPRPKPRTGAAGPDHDVIIVGGGPAGVACALECERQGIDYLLLESAHLFTTLENFPRAKPILAKPDGIRGRIAAAHRKRHQGKSPGGPAPPARRQGLEGEDGNPGGAHPPRAPGRRMRARGLSWTPPR